MPKPKRHPTFTLDELRAMRHCLVVTDRRDMVGAGDADSALAKVTDAVSFREDAARTRALRRNVFTGQFNAPTDYDQDDDA